MKLDYLLSKDACRNLGEKIIDKGDILLYIKK